MKRFRVGFAVLAVALLVVFAAGRPQAFHSGGVAECAGCHSMHAPAAGGSFLLVGTDPSSACMTCHRAADTSANSYHIATAKSSFGPGETPVERTPGGDFAWLLKNYTYTGGSEDGAMHGHNVVAADFGYVTDPTNTTSPGGGNYTSSNLGCQSCHDPHSPARRLSNGTYATGLTMGQATAPIIASGSYNNSPLPQAGQAVGVYRLLRGLGAQIDGVTFPNSVAIAVAPSTYNQSEATNMVRVAYGASGDNTWGNWCGTCHNKMHTGGEMSHPVDESLGPEIANNYNAYIASGDLSGNGQTFTSLVPFIEATGDIATLQSHAKNNNSFMNGPGSSDKVSCLSCHRAHASGMVYGLRFDIEYEFMTKGGDYIGSDNPLVGTTGRGPLQSRGRTIAEWKASYYDRPATHFASYQRVLCNKCHAKD
jgi:hypothetical protein